MTIGRIPEISNEEVHKLGQELIDFLMQRKEQNKPVIHLTEWYIFEKKMYYDEWDNLRKRQVFLQYYDAALDLMSYFTMSNNNLPTAYGSRFLALYSKDLRAHEKEIKSETAEIEAAAKAKVISSLSEEELEQNRRVIEAVQAFQKKE